MSPTRAPGRASPTKGSRDPASPAKTPGRASPAKSPGHGSQGKAASKPRRAAKTSPGAAKGGSAAKATPGAKGKPAARPAPRAPKGKPAAKPAPGAAKREPARKARTTPDARPGPASDPDQGPKILVAGAGAIGGWLGAHLCAAGFDVRLLGRQALADAVVQDGLVVSGLTEFSGHVPVDTAPRGGPYDIIFITCKAHATHDVAQQVAPLLARDGTLVTLQNGLGNAELLARHVPPDRVVVAVTSHGVTVERPGRLVHTGSGSLRVGPFPRTTMFGAFAQASPDAQAQAAAVQRVMAVLTSAGLGPEAIADSTGHLWLKGAVNAGINPLCAIHGVTNGGLRAHWEEAMELVAEVVALSRAAGVALPGDALAALASTVEATAANRCSMLQDVDAGRPTEIDHITGYFVRVARRLGYPLFANEAVYRRVKALEASYLGGEASDATMRRAARSFTWG